MTPPFIRPAEPRDTEATLAIYAPFITDSHTSFEMEVPLPAAFWKRIEMAKSEGGFLVCEWDGKIAGYAYAGIHRERKAYQWSREVSVYIHPDFHRKRVAHALYTSLFEVCHLRGFCHLFAGIALPNSPSEAFHRSMGFHPIGVYHQIGYKKGAWRDVSWWEKSLGKTRPVPGRILNWEEVILLPEWNAALASGNAMIRNQ